MKFQRLLRTPTPAEKEGLGRGVRTALWGIALILLVGVVGPAHTWFLGLLVGVTLVVYGVRALHRAAAVRSWPRVPARVVSTSLAEVVEPGRVSLHTYYHPVVEFEYSTTRGQFTTAAYSAAPTDHRSLDAAEARALLAPYEIGADIEVYVHPDNHSDAIVQPRISPRRRSHYLAAILAGAIVCVLTVLLTWR